MENKYELEKNITVNAYYYGNVLEMTDTNPISKQSGIRPISKDEYIDLATGMTMKFNHQNKQRIQSPENLRKTFRNLRRLIIANFNAGDIWLTLTYRQDDGRPITDTKRVYRDFKAFWRRFVARYGHCDYLIVLEPQASGSWHLHGLIKKQKGKLPFIDNNLVVEPMWGQGFTMTKRLKDTDNVASYLMAYLTDIPKDEIIPGTSKKGIIKGARLHYYPSSVHIYRGSRGLRRPVKKKGVKSDILFDYGLSRDAKADAAFYHEHKIKNGKKISHITEFYDNVNNKKETNQARQDHD